MIYVKSVVKTNEYYEMEYFPNTPRYYRENPEKLIKENDIITYDHYHGKTFTVISNNTDDNILLMKLNEGTDHNVEWWYPLVKFFKIR